MILIGLGHGDRMAQHENCGSCSRCAPLLN